MRPEEAVLGEEVKESLRHRGGGGYVLLEGMGFIGIRQLMKYSLPVS